MRKILNVVPLSRRLLLIIWPFLVIISLLVWLFIESMGVLIAARGYAEGESLWSKAQKTAVFHLIRYAETRDEAYFDKYASAIAVTRGDEIARTELQKDAPDYKLVWQGMLQGRNDPGDIGPAITLFRRFQHYGPMQKVIELWTAGDAQIALLDRAARELHDAVKAGEAGEERVRPILHRILEIDATLTPLTDDFSKTLGVASRKAQRLLILAILATAGTLLPLGIYLSRRMLRHSEEFERALQLSEERFNLAVAGSNDGLWDWNIASDELYYSPRFRELLDCDDEQLENSLSALAARLYSEDRLPFIDALNAHLNQDVPFDVEIRSPVRTGEYRWFRLRGQSVRNNFGKAIRMAGALTDITDVKNAAAELFSEKERAQVTLASIGDGVVTTDIEGWVQYLNPVAESLVGWSAENARGLPIQALFRLIDEASRKPTRSPIEVVLNEERNFDGEPNTLLQRNDGVEIPIVHSAAPMRDRSGAVVGVVLVLHDVSRERQYAAKLSYQASHDSLTGLINRSEFERRLALALQTAASAGRQHAVMYLDLDQFKVVNDTCGHAAGDQLMRQVSTLLQQCLREGDTLARLGGDEFGVLLENCPADAALRIGDKLRQTLTDFHFAWAHLSFNIGVSIGLVNVEDGLFTLAEVLRAADTACYMAKEKGRNRVQVYHPEDSELTLRQGEMEWVGRLQKALDENRFVLYSQEIVPISGVRGLGAHCELLVRMLDERGQLVPPMAFIPAAERYNLMPAVDRWVLRTALATLSRLNSEGDSKIDLCAINLSGGSIGDERFLDFVREQLASVPVLPETICFEITETAAIANLDKATRFIQELKLLGCRFSLDDFGAGMSSFAYLKHLPVDYLKIDGVFVKDMADDPIDRAMVEAINNVGHVMGKQTIAEFVDGEAVLSALREIGVDFAQGYGVSKPRPFGIRQLATAPLI
ncbi:MAG TPA: EAL domain-containing protein [Burkholderiales bacterium]|nr:EAL domain-containing protein [Burkholderiales bacterium]